MQSTTNNTYNQGLCSQLLRRNNIRAAQPTLLTSKVKYRITESCATMLLGPSQSATLPSFVLECSGITTHTA